MPEIDEINFLGDPNLVNEEMRVSLAKLYADTGLRNYLIRASQAAHQNALTCLDRGDIDDARFYANRAKILKQLVEQGKAFFVKIQTMERKVGSIVDSSVVTNNEA